MIHVLYISENTRSCRLAASDFFPNSTKQIPKAPPPSLTSPRAATGGNADWVSLDAYTCTCTRCACIVVILYTHATIDERRPKLLPKLLAASTDCGRMVVHRVALPT